MAKGDERTRYFPVSRKRFETSGMELEVSCVAVYEVSCN